MKKRKYYQSVPPSDDRKNEWVSIIIASLLTVSFMAVIGYAIYNFITAL